MRKLLADYGGRLIYKCLIAYGRRLASYGSPHTSSFYSGIPFIRAMISSGEMTVQNPLSSSYIYSSNVSDHYRISHTYGGFGAHRQLALCLAPSHG